MKTPADYEAGKITWSVNQPMSALRIASRSLVAMCLLAAMQLLRVVAAEGQKSQRVGAYGPDGRTIDPLTLPRARQVWQPVEPPAGALTRPHRCRIVSYADDMARHDCGSYCAPRQILFAEDVDVDGDGDVRDDYVAYLPFSLTETLSMPDWPKGPRLPERFNATMHGGRSWWVANALAKNRKRRFVREIGINPNHSGPFWDGRAEDHPLQGNPDEESPTSFLLNYITIVWTKPDFLNGGDRYRVTFDHTSRLASLCTRGYWYGYDEVRMVVLDGDQWFISDMAQFDIPKDIADYAGGRCFICYPTKARWAKWKPEGYRNNFDAKRATFAPHQFQDVRAVGWHIAKVNRQPSNSHVKWYGFEADAVVHRPAQPSVNLAMAEIAKPGIPPFFITTCEIPYAFWKKVFRYGDAPINTLEARYTFAKSGDMGSMRFGLHRHGQNEPVTNVTLYDALAFCNCLSQMEGKTPCYYTDPEFKTLFRNMHIATYARGRQLERGLPPAHCNPKWVKMPEPRIYVRWDADGYRLPTIAEWAAAAGKPAISPQAAWFGANAAGTTHPVGQKQPNENGLYDVIGNVWELAWAYGDIFDPQKHQVQVALGGDFHGPGDPTAADRAASPYGDSPFDGNYNIGLRIVCRRPGLPAPPTGDVARLECPAWVIKRGQKTAARRRPEPPRRPVLEMVRIPGGKFTHPETGVELTISPFEMARCEVTFAKWLEVKRWAEAHGYTFGRQGHMGSMYWFSFPHSPDEPVTFITWHDCVVWCNALSEMEGRTPFYYTDPAKTKVYRHAFAYRPIRVAGWEIVDEAHPMKKYALPRNNEPWLFQKWDSDGYRLPTEAEFEYALQAGTGRRYFWQTTGGSRDDFAWSIYNSGGTTHPVATRKPNPFGLHDMIGNVYEWTNSGRQPKNRDPRFDTNNPKRSRYWARGLSRYKYDIIGNPLRVGGSWFWGGVRGWHQRFSFAEWAHDYMPDVGFRVVRCEAGTHPPNGDFPLVVPTLLEFDEKDFDDLAGATYRGSIRRDGVHDTAGLLRFNGIKWKVNLGGPIKSSPVLTAGMVYIGGPRGFHALDPASGAERWHIPVRGGVNGSACVAGGVVYFTAMDGNVYAADAKTGALRWKKKPRGRYGKPLMSTPAVAYDTVFAYVAGTTVGFEAGTGREFWHCRAGRRGRAAVTLHPRYLVAGGTAYTLEKAQRLFFSNHLIDWTSDAELTACVVGDLYWGASSGRGGYSFAKVGCGDLAARRTRWSHFIEQHLPQPERSYSSCSPAVWEGRIYIGVEKGIMYAFDAFTGKKLQWEFNAGRNNGLHSAPSIAARSGTIYFGSQSGELFAVDARTARLRWRVNLGGAIETSPWPADGVLYVSCDDGHLYAVH